MKVRAAGLTDVGKVRAHNEDHLALVDEMGLFMVADGMGGQLAGEVASHLAVETICQVLAVAESPPEEDEATTADRLVTAIRTANRAIFEAGQNNPDWCNMGTTVVVAKIDDDQLTVAHVGDSRIYLLRARTITQLTDDHSLVAEQQRLGLLTREEAATSRMKNVITRALGAHPQVVVDVARHGLLTGDRIVLCSDGLTNMVTDDEIQLVAANHEDPAEACARLVGMANQRGGKDNITVILVVVAGE